MVVKSIKNIPINLKVYWDIYLKAAMILNNTFTTKILIVQIDTICNNQFVINCT